MIKIIVDSCCDTTEEMRDEIDLLIAPLKISLSDGYEVVDSLDLDIENLLNRMQKSKWLKTNCPSVEDYYSLMERCDECIVITLADFLSGSYNSACAAREMIIENYPDKKVYVLNSQSVASGETLLALYIDKLIKEGMSFEDITTKAEIFAEKMCTVFVLEDLGNMVRNGRIDKVTEKIISLLNIYPILYKFKSKEIKVAAKVRGLKNSLNRMTNLIGEWTSPIKPKSIILTMSQCCCFERAVELKDRILSECNAIKDVIISATSGLSSVYASRGGIVIAFLAESL
ncbi:MAG: DegV family protein [Ruminococcaceae bacterium]|nr:DegV family protein [Oscillospiraceae bacterium]